VRTSLVEIQGAAMAFELEIARLEDRQDECLLNARQSIGLAREALELVHHAHATRSQLGISPVRRRLTLENNGSEDGSNGPDGNGSSNGSTRADSNGYPNGSSVEDGNGYPNGSNVEDRTTYPNGSDVADENESRDGRSVSDVNGCGSGSNMEDDNGGGNKTANGGDNGSEDGSANGGDNGGDDGIILMEVRRSQKRPYSRFLDLMALEADEDSDLELLEEAGE